MHRCSFHFQGFRTRMSQIRILESCSMIEQGHVWPAIVRHPIYQQPPFPLSRVPKNTSQIHLDGQLFTSFLKQLQYALISANPGLIID